MAEPVVVQPIEELASGSWGAASDITVVVSSHGRAGLLPGLLQGLDRQDHGCFDVVVVDNGSQDGTWQVLADWLASTPCSALGLRVAFCDGPAVPRNTALLRSSAPLVAFTDDDCLPSVGWLRALADAMGEGVSVVQGRTLPEADGWGGPWGRSLTVTARTGLYETANLCVRRSDALSLGGFPAERLLTGRAFGEDVQLGAALARLGSVVFAGTALVEHRVLPGSYRDFLRERRRLEGFPLLVRAIPELRDRLLLEVFLSRRTATADVGVLGLLAAAATRRPAVALVAVPWALACWRASTSRSGRPRAVRAGQLAIADVVGLGGLLRGSAKAHRLVV